MCLKITINLSVCLLLLNITTSFGQIEINSQARFNAKLAEAGDDLVVAYLFADWCGPCRKINPVVDEIAVQNDDVVVLKVNVDDNDDIALEYNVLALPTFIFFKNNEKVDEFGGADADKLRATVNKHKDR